jgi:hypothetical protein
VPPHERLRSHDEEELSPVDKSREHEECDSRGIVQAARLDLPLEIERQLLSRNRFSAASLWCDEQLTGLLGCITLAVGR